MHSTRLLSLEKRIELFLRTLPEHALPDNRSVEVAFHACKAETPFGEWDLAQFAPLKPGDRWGGAWEYAWFRVTCAIPQEWSGQELVLQLDVGGEGLVFDNGGNVLQGISNGSVFKVESARDLISLPDCLRDDDSVELYIEATASGQFGIADPVAHRYQDPFDPPPFEARLARARVSRFRQTVWELLLDIRVRYSYLKTLAIGSPRRIQVTEQLNEVMDTYLDDPVRAEITVDLLRSFRTGDGGGTPQTAVALGHAHIDTGWLWRIEESKRKCARTFANQLALLDRYPDYVFGASSPLHYQFVKHRHPELYQRIKQRVAEGRWELLGGMWVEADTNLVSGESLVRQLLYGKRFFLQEFGVEVTNLWLPDVFGYSAALPQLLCKAGIDSFLTQKLSWNDVTPFPHTNFRWRGFDGSEVVAHFPPENTYCSELLPATLLPAAERNRKQGGGRGCFLAVFGIGDGGGGPREDHIEHSRRIGDLDEGVQVLFGRADHFFRHLNDHKADLPVWDEELYLEFHRGTYTTQALVKKHNRLIENRVRTVELLWSALPGSQYPADRIEELWKRTLLHQFHDILPGSSIREVYEDSRQDHEEILSACDDLIHDAMGRLGVSDPEMLTVFNPAPTPFEGILPLPDKVRDWVMVTEAGEAVPFQDSETGRFFAVTVPALAFQVLQRTGGTPYSPPDPDDGSAIENDYVLYEFSKDGELLRGFDKERQREILAGDEPGNRLSLYVDRPTDWDAWDIDYSYRNNLVMCAQGLRPPKRTRGPLFQEIVFTLGIGDSVIEQRIVLADNSRLLTFHTTVDWREEHRMLRACFPVNVDTDRATHDIQFGHVLRPTTHSTPEEEARFEVPALRYVDLSGDEYGVALLNDCKYGYHVWDNLLDLNLLRSPTWPDPTADRGWHEFTYALLPHPGPLLTSSVMAEAETLNRAPVIFPGLAASGERLPWRVEGEGIVLETVKQAESGEGVILRLVERHGRTSTGWLTVDTPGMLHGTDLLERPLEPDAQESDVTSRTRRSFTLRPFEVRTLLYTPGP